MITMQKAKLADAAAVACLAQRLWPHHRPDELQAEFVSLLQNSNAAVFLAFQAATPIGFAQCQLRHDYVEGTESSPVGYLEGIFVLPEYRKTGVARMLLTSCESWAKEQGCTEFASDCELGNTESLRFHLNVGFTEANRIICFTKKL
ncbi:MAG: GNAT family N-acetyltransferase [Oscillospiraceae bacterium]|nr:GNAT family N-acetyltransferase [Oscillospiraceae bacterium]